MGNNPKLAVYDAAWYDYSEFWQGREYEHRAEIEVLKKIFCKKRFAEWFIDIGGSYGRLFDTYQRHSKFKVIVDYSMLALKKAKKTFKNRPDVFFVAANVYNLPFKNNTFEGGIMVRVMHHLEQAQSAIDEIYRVLSSNSYFILEFPNKYHLKNRIRSLFNKAFSTNLDRKKFEIPSDGSKRGLPPGAKGIFLSYNPKMILSTLNNSGFVINKKFGVSFFRSQFVKKTINYNLLSKIDSFIQNFSLLYSMAPSVFLDSIKISSRDNTNASKISDVLVCPKCKKQLTPTKTYLQCTHCNLHFPIDKGIYDLRFPISKWLKK